MDYRQYFCEHKLSWKRKRVYRYKQDLLKFYEVHKWWEIVFENSLIENIEKCGFHVVKWRHRCVTAEIRESCDRSSCHSHISNDHKIWTSPKSWVSCWPFKRLSILQCTWLWQTDWTSNFKNENNKRSFNQRTLNLNWYYYHPFKCWFPHPQASVFQRPTQKSDWPIKFYRHLRIIKR